MWAVCLHPPPNNYFDTALLGALADAYEELAAGTSCRAIVLRSEGRHFCAGLDFANNKEQDIAALYRNALRIFAAPLPVVARSRAGRLGDSVSPCRLTSASPPGESLRRQFLAAGFSSRIRSDGDAAGGGRGSGGKPTCCSSGRPLAGRRRWPRAVRRAGRRRHPEIRRPPRPMPPLCPQQVRWRCGPSVPPCVRDSSSGSWPRHGSRMCRAGSGCATRRTSPRGCGPRPSGASRRTSPGREGWRPARPDTSSTPAFAWVGSPADRSAGVTEEQARQYDESGYFLLEGALRRPTQVDELVAGHRPASRRAPEDALAQSVRAGASSSLGPTRSPSVHTRGWNPRLLRQTGEGARRH